MAGAYVFLIRAETWSAKQSLIVRDDLLGQSYKPGRFDSLDSMKSAQETILEIARRPQVIRNTLVKLGPESKGLFGTGASNWPSEEVIETVQGAISFNAPNGAEFGKTEVIVLKTSASSRERARQFIQVLFEEIIAKTNDVRMRRLQSMESELTQTRDGAQQSLDEVTQKLKTMDVLLGPDVNEMDSLVNSLSGDNSLKRDISTIQTEKRQVVTELNTAISVLEMLQDSNASADQMVSSSAVIKYQPALSPLNNALVSAQQTLAEHIGRYTKLHPIYISARNSVNELQSQIAGERNALISTLQLEISTKQSEMLRLENESEKLDDRLVNLSSLRADNLGLRAAMEKRTEILQNAQSDLAEIQGLASGAKNATLLTAVDEAQVSTRPDGLGKKMLILAGAFGGLLFGLGLVMLVAPPSEGGEPAPIDRAAAPSGPRNHNPITPSLGDSLRDIVSPVVASVGAATSGFRKGATSSQAAGGQVTSAQTAQSKAPLRTPKTPTGTPVSSVASKVDAKPKPTVPVTSTRPPASNVSSKSTTEELAAQALKLLDAKSTQIKKAGQATARSAPASAPASAPPAADPVAETAETVSAAALVDQAFANEVATPVAKPAVGRTSAETVPMGKGSQKIDVSKIFPTASKAQTGAGIETKKSSSQHELQRRRPNVRPVDLAKSVEENGTSFVRVKPAEPKAGRSENPFLKEKNKTEAVDPGESKRSEAIDTLIKDSIGKSDDAAMLPVPEQIRKLSDSIANFAKPIAKKAEDKNDF